MKKELGDILLKARELINGERQSEYGDPRESFERIARFWSVYLGHEVSGKDVAMMMVLLKMSREMSRHKPDNLVDMAGYVGLADALTQKAECVSHEETELCENCQHISRRERMLWCNEYQQRVDNLAGVRSCLAFKENK